MGLLSWLFGRRAAPQSAKISHAPKPEPQARVPQIVWRPGSYPMDVVGESYYQAALTKIAGGHNRHGHELEVVAHLVREPMNAQDKNAVRVEISGQKVGFIAREQAERISGAILERNLDRVACLAQVRGGWRTNQYDAGHFGVRLSVPNHGWIDFGIGEEKPSRARNSAPRQPTNRPAPAPDGPLKGERVAIFGASADVSLAGELAGAGATIVAGVGKTTTMFVVASDRPFSFGLTRSAGYRKAEDAVAAGQALRILSAAEARALIA